MGLGKKNPKVVLLKYTTELVLFVFFLGTSSPLRKYLFLIWHARLNEHLVKIACFFNNFARFSGILVIVNDICHARSKPKNNKNTPAVKQQQNIQMLVFLSTS